MSKTVRDTIKEVTTEHLKLGSQLFGQCITAVGWVNDTIPSDAPNLVELSMADVMAGGVVVGSALMGKRPIYVVRYQGFQWFNSPIIANYAGKSQELWGIPCPIFIRSIAMEGGIGPVAGSSHHGIYYRMPGIKIAAPMTPNEYRQVYKEFMAGDDPIYVSEHRKSYDNKLNNLGTITHETQADLVIFPFSVTRFIDYNQIGLLNGLTVDVYHQYWINPLRISDFEINRLKKSKYGGLVLDDDYPNGIAKQIAYDLMLKSGRPVRVLALKEKTAGFQSHNDNLPPNTDEVLNLMEEMCK